MTTAWRRSGSRSVVATTGSPKVLAPLGEAPVGGEDHRARIVRHGRYVVFQPGRGGGAPSPVRRNPAPDRSPAKTARYGGLTGTIHGAAEPRENRPSGSTSATRAGRASLPTGLQWLSRPGIRCQTRVPIDQRSAEEQLSGCQPTHLGMSVEMNARACSMEQPRRGSLAANRANLPHGCGGQGEASPIKARAASSRPCSDH